MKTWISETFTAIAAVSAIDGAVQWLTAHPIIPEPFGSFALATLAVVGFVLRKRSKSA